MENEYKFYAFKLTGIIIVIFVIQLLSAGFTDMFVLDQSSWLQPWRFVSSIFLHGGIGHLAYNMFALVLFGGILEKVVGSKNFLTVFFVTGIFASLLSINFYDSALGASGAIFGVIGALVILRPTMTVWTFSLPMPMALAGILWAAGDLIGVFTPSNIANIAHLAGMGFGLILGIYYRNSFSRKKNDNTKFSFTIDESSMRRWEDQYMR